MSALTLNTPTENIKTELCQALKASGDDLRLQILAVLAKESFGVLELCQIFDAKQSGMSHHLKVLAKALLVSTRREGNTIFYRRSDEPASQALQNLRKAIYLAANHVALNEAYRANLNRIHQNRAEASRSFFIENATAFREQQDLIAEFCVYSQEVGKVLDASNHPSNLIALEVGPGTGEFLPELSRRFKQVLALDTSEAMLQQSQKHCQSNKVENIEFIHGDTQHAALSNAALDCVVINMVLHHTPSPSRIFEDIAQSLKPGGVLIVCELGAHDQDWVRQACGDQWLGFDSQDLSEWAKASQLNEGISRYFALRNGFQIQIHQYIKQ